MTALATASGGTTRVLLAADQIATRTGVRLALGDEADCSEFADAEDAVAAAVRDHPDVCVVDFTSPGRGVRIAAEIAAKVPGASVVVMTHRIDEDEFVAAVRAGASGYLSESVDPARLPHVVRSLLRGEAVVPRRFVGRLIDELRGREERRRRLDLPGRGRVDVTAREWEVLELLRQGLSTRAVADLLGISSVTVRRHTSAVQQKLGVGSRKDLLRLLSDVEPQPS
jgi:DNA-binding NarL/FixJ family response regulator